MNSGIQIIFIFSIVIGVITVILHIIFAYAVYVDAEKLVQRDKLETALVSGPVWAIATLIFGVLVAIGYWLINRSSIALLRERFDGLEIKDRVL